MSTDTPANWQAAVTEANGLYERSASKAAALETKLTSLAGRVADLDRLPGLVDLAAELVNLSHEAIEDPTYDTAGS